jgi:hypothetical protein
VDHSWIDIPEAKDGQGRIVHQRGVTPSPGLYMLGLTWQHTRGSALLGWVGNDAAFLLLAVDTRPADALGIGGPRLRCGCTETCWCKRPGLTVFRWVTPGRWHHIGLTADEKRSRHSQALADP